MLRIGLVDDEREFLKVLERRLRRECEKRGISCWIDGFENPELLYFQFAERKAYDVCFVDIEMPQMDGRELAGRIRQLDERVKLIFLTSHREFVRAGYGIGAFDFLTKDRLLEDLPETMDHLIRVWLEEENQYYTIQTSSRYERIPFGDIIYIYKRDQNICIVTKNGETHERKSLKKIQEELDEEQFVLVERGHIVNLAHIVRVNAREIELSSGKTVTASRDHIGLVKERLGKYYLRKLAMRKE